MSTKTWDYKCTPIVLLKCNWFLDNTVLQLFCMKVNGCIHLNKNKTRMKNNQEYYWTVGKNKITCSLLHHMEHAVNK